MARPYKTISNQNMYDVTVQSFGSIDDLDLVMRDTPDLNEAIPFSTDFVLADTDDELARQFFAGNTKFATGDSILARAYSNDYGSAYGIWGDPTLAPVGGSTVFPYIFPYILS